MSWCAPLSLILLGAASAGDSGSEAPSRSEPIEIVLFSDFQCPFCAQIAQPIRALQATGADGIPVRISFKNFPLAIHPSAPLAHQAALAAAEQGKFWEMHDLLFANPNAMARENFLEYAAKLGLDPARFAKDMDSDQIKEVIQADLADGAKLGVTGTPTFFVDGKSYSGARSVEQLKKLVQDAHLRRRVLAEIPDELLSSGPATAPVTLEFFGDLQSPVTRPALDVVRELMRRYPSGVRLQFRNFPLAFHPQAALAHEAAMAAAPE
jgi:protein-disulfide isomerase